VSDAGIGPATALMAALDDTSSNASSGAASTDESPASGLAVASRPDHSALVIARHQLRRDLEITALRFTTMARALCGLDPGDATATEADEEIGSVKE